MKKTLIALAAVAATGAASAQVTLYGKVDLGYKTTTTKDATGATTGKTSGMSSGNQNGSRWGLKGTEDLGGGLKASFNYEASVTANTGAGNDNFARRSVLELAGGFGKVGMGRDYNPTFSLIGATDPTGVDGSTTQNLPAGVRDSNMFLYTSPNFGGVTVKAGLISQRSGVDEKTAKTNGTDLSATYANGPLKFGLAYRVMKTTTAAADATYADADKTIVATAAKAASTTKTKQTTLGASYDLGVAKAYFNYITHKVDGSGKTSKETNLGVTAPMGAVTLLAAVGRDSYTGAKSASDYTLGADYSLSKRTNVYARVYKNGIPGGGAFISSTKPATTPVNGKITGMFLGVRHSF